jgi:predicted DNA-binding protein
VELGNKVLRSIYIEVEQLDKLKKLSQRTKVPQAVYIREALDLVLKKYAQQLETVPSPEHD